MPSFLTHQKILKNPIKSIYSPLIYQLQLSDIGKKLLKGFALLIQISKGQCIYLKDQKKYRGIVYFPKNFQVKNISYGYL